MIKRIFLLSLLSLLPLLAFGFLAGLLPAYAAVRCETQYGQYGNTQTCVTTGELQVNKTVWNGSSFVDNIPASVKTFKPGEEVDFHLQIKNVGGDNTLNTINVTDTLPAFLVPMDGTFSFSLGSLTPGQTEERGIKARVVTVDKLPTDATIICNSNTTNTLEAHTSDMSDTDTAQICIENRVLGAAPALPASGPEHWLLVESAFLAAGVGGFYLRKFRAL